MSYVLQLEAARARVKAALIDLLIVTSDGGNNGEFDMACASVEVTPDEVNGVYSVGLIMPNGDMRPSTGGSL